MAFQADSIFWVEVEKIVPNPYQPRREFDEAKLKELAESVRMYGILQPLTVTRNEIQNQDGSFKTEYELIAGERRLRASKLAGLSLVPVIIRDGEQTEQEKLELAIIENLQREDLNSVDRALAFRQLVDVFGLSHTQVALKVGRSREYVSNTIRLLALPDYMLSSLRTNDITEGHARTLLMLNDRPEEQDVLFREILLKKLSVREVEKIARSIAIEKVRRRDTIDTNLIEIEQRFADALGTRVSIVKTDFGGRMTIDYFSVDDLEEMLVRMKREAAERSTPVPDAYKDESNDTVVSETVDEASVALAALTASTGLEPVPAPEPIAVQKVEEVLPEVMPEPSVFSPEASNTVSGEDMPAPTPITPSVAQVVPPASEVSAPAPITTPAPRLSLRDQLASMLGNQTPETPAPTPVVATPVSTVVPEAPKSTVDDETDLYSMNRFTI